MKRLLTAFAVLGFLCLPAMAANIYADDDGTVNTGTCTVTQTGASACTLARGLTVLACGDTLTLADGTYTDNGVTLTHVCASGTRITIKSANQNQAIIKPPNGVTNGYALLVNGSSYLTLDGIEVNCGNHSGRSCACYKLDGSDHITIQHSIARNCGGGTAMDASDEASGIELVTSNNVTITDNDIITVGSGDGTIYEHGIYLATDTSSVTVTGNRISGVASGWGMQVYHSGSCSSGCVITGNTIHGGSYGGILLDGGDSGQFSNNVVYSNSQDGIYIYASGASNWSIYNNTVHANGRYCVYSGLDGNPTGMLVRNNICWLNSTNSINTGAGVTQDHNLCSTGCASSADPQFVAAGSANYHLSVDDNQGTATGAPSTDFSGLSRSNPPDRGAYEFVATGSPGVTVFVGSGVIR